MRFGGINHQALYICVCHVPGLLISTPTLRVF